jgi:hypothetical protein
MRELTLILQALIAITSVKMVEIAGGFEVAISHAACGGICIRGLSVRGTVSSAMPSICM